MDLKQSPNVLVGVNYFAGWWDCEPNKWQDANGNDWRPRYPGRVPLLGAYNTQDTIDKELTAAAAYGVDFFNVLWYYNEPGLEREPHANLLQRGVEGMMASTVSDAPAFMLEFCNHPPFEVTTLDQWIECIDTWVPMMQHPRYLRVGGRAVFKVHGAHYFLQQNGGDVSKCQAQLQMLRDAARRAGVGDMIIGGGVAANESVGVESPYNGLFDFTNTYMDLPHIERREEDYAFDVLADFAAEGRRKHRDDVIPYVPYVPAGWNPRPWPDGRACFALPTRQQWEGQLQRVRHDLQEGDQFGFPLPKGDVQKALTIYAWNEFGEGGIVAPNEGEGYMKLEAIKSVFAAD